MTVIASTGPSTRPEDGIVRPRARVVTLTPSPAIDRLYVVDAVLPDEVNRARDVRWFLSGKASTSPGIWRASAAARSR